MIIIASILTILTLGTIQLIPDAPPPRPSRLPPMDILGVRESGSSSTSTQAFAADVPVDESAYRSLLPRTNDRTASPRLRADAPEAPAITARAATVFDVASKKVLYEKNPETPAALASITKLMTALVVMDHNPDFEEEYVMQPADRREGGRIYLYNGDRVTRGDLFNAMLVGSANTATIALVHSLGVTEEQFVRAMNEKAYSLGLRKTTFADPVGLSADNRSTAFEVIELTRAALADPTIQRAVLQDSYTITTRQGDSRTIVSTDQLLDVTADFALAGGKTGYLGAAGYCFTGQFSGPEGEREIITVVLGSATVDTRFSETAALVNWTYDNYVWP